jgi:hypothetical protein
VRDTDPELLDSLCEVMLVVDLGNDDLGCPGQRRDGCRSRATVVDDCCDSREERLQIDLVDGQAVGLAVRE